MNSPKAAAKVPSITVLRQALDYGDPRLPRCDAFYDDFRVFRKTYVSPDGLSGSELHRWKSQDHQSGLVRMATAYLERNGKGALFWPDNPTSQYYNKLQYSTHHGVIRRNVKLLFFRLNLQQYRTAKYRNKNKSNGREGARRPGMSTEDPIDLDAVADDRPNGLSSASSERAAEGPYTGLAFQPASFSSTDPALMPPETNPNESGERSRDPYAVPVSREPSLSGVSLRPSLNDSESSQLSDPDADAPKGQSRSRTFDESSSSRRPFAEMSVEEPAAKRAKTQHRCSERPRGSTARRGRRWAGITWTSPREKKIRRDPNMATEEELEAAVRSPTSSGRSSPRAADRNSTATVSAEPNRSLMTSLRVPSWSSAGDDPGQGSGGGNRVATEGDVRGAADGVQDATDGAQDAAGGVQDAAVGAQDAADGVQDAADGVQDAAVGAQDAADGVQDAAVGAQDAADGVQDAADGVQDAAAGVQVPSTPSVDVGDATARADSPVSPGDATRPVNPNSSQAEDPGNSAAVVGTPALADPPATANTNQPQQPQEQPSQKPMIQFTYRAVLARSPILESQEWSPRGGFRSLTLAQLLEETPLELDADSNGLLFTLIGPGLRIKSRIYYGEGHQFESMKRKFDSFIRTFIARKQRGEEAALPLLFELEMEAIRDESAGMGVEPYEGDVSW